MDPTPHLLPEIAAWVASSRPSGTRDASRRLLMDQIGISLAGRRLLGRHPAFRLVDRMDGTFRATTWTEEGRGLAPYVVLANRCAGDELELTAGPECVAAAVAAAEIADASLGQLLDALAVGADVEEYLRNWLGEPAERHGLHPPAFFGAVASAAVSSRLLDLPAAGCAAAMSTAAALAPQSSYAAFSNGARAKTLYGAWSQSLGLWAALWAPGGMSGPLTAFEGSRGIAQALLDTPGPVGPPPFDPDGRAVTRVTFKPFPCNRASHAVLTALEMLWPRSVGAASNTEQIDEMDAIEAIEVLTYPYAVELDRRSRGSSPIAAQVSIPTTIALRLVLGHLDPGRAYTDENLARAAVQRLRDKITVGVLPGTEAGARRRVARVTIRTGDGRDLTAETETRWNANAPATDAELRERFDGFTRATRAAGWWDTLDSTPVRRMIGY